MLIKQKNEWQLNEHNVTPEEVWLSRRKLIRAALGAGGACVLGLATGPAVATALKVNTAGFSKNQDYDVLRAISSEEDATKFNNFYEFGSAKNIWKQAQKIKTEPWLVTVDGKVNNPVTMDASQFIKKLGQPEERIYRFRCVEPWAMAVPWIGIPMIELVKFADPAPEAKYLRMESFFDPIIAPGQKQSWYPWPYVESLTLAEASNDLSLIATGLYGKDLLKQNGAPLRAVVPWKYGFKSIKSIVRFSFTSERPKTFWETVAPSELGFWANVNPDVDHPRWSQKTETMIGSQEVFETVIFNGYSKQVQHMYRDMAHLGPNLFR